eukprot:jgi/Orpsp1_1/1189527/evm.model.d7180000072621.1
MKFIDLLILLVFIKFSICKNKFRGEGSSRIFLSNISKFNYNEIKSLIVFGDSHSSVGTNFTDMTYSGYNRCLGKNWALQLIEINNMTLYDFAISGSPINND